MPDIAFLASVQKYDNGFYQYLPLSQLSIIVKELCYGVAIEQPALFIKIIGAASVEEAFPGYPTHALHEKIFWLIRALVAMLDNNLAEVLKYHQLLSIAGIGSNLKFAYGFRLKTWIEEKITAS